MSKLNYQERYASTTYQVKPAIEVSRGLTAQYYKERMDDAAARRAKRTNDPKEERRKAIAEDLRAGMTKTNVKAKHRCSHNMVEDLLADLLMGKYGGMRLKAST